MLLVTHSLGEICDEGNGVIRTGPFGSQLHQSDYVDEGVPVIMPKDIVSGKVAPEGVARVRLEDAERLSQHRLQRGDIVYGRRGDIGRHAFITAKEEGWLCGTGCLRISVGNGAVDSLFLHYYLGQDQLIGWIENQAIGATMPNLNTDILRRMPITYPPLPTQRKIASILCAYDDLIELNLRRIAILEEMAMRLYREWFVHFRFPGHEHVRMVDSEMGGVPEGWKVQPIGDVVEIVGGGTPSTQEAQYWEGGSIVWFTPSDLTKAGTMFIRDSAKRITELGLRNSSARVFPPYSVMMTSRATIGVVALNQAEACTNQGFIVCIPNRRVTAWQLYCWIEDSSDVIDSIASGATYKEISRGEFRGLPILVADEATSTRLGDAVTPILAQVENLLDRNANLRRTRDLLLPKLVSGGVVASVLE